jgi:putative ABC transport system permease protein
MSMRFEHWLYSLPLKWRSLFRRDDVERDLDDEIRYHLEQQADELVARGVDRDVALRHVRRNFGGIEPAKEQCRDARGVGAIETLIHDVRYAARVLRRQPAFAAVAVLTLALGIGANAAVFSLVDGILLAPLPYAAPAELVSVKATYPKGAFAAMRDEIRSLEVAAYATGKSVTLSGASEPIRVTGTRVSAELLSILGVRPAIGRWFRAGEDVMPQDTVVILSHPLWSTRFRGDPAIAGRFVDIDGVPREVVGVMPASFRFPSSRTDIWLPLGIDPRDTSASWGGDFMPIVGRLRSGVSMAEAAADVRLFQSRVLARFPWRMPADWNRQIVVTPLHDAIVGDQRARLGVLFVAVALVLVIACANVANLSLSRAASRQREIGVRTAIGASPRRIARQLLTESIVLALLGGVAGVLVGGLTLGFLKLALPPDTPRLAEAALNFRAVAYTGVMAILTGCAFGLAPVASALGLRLRSVLDSGGRSGGSAVATPVRSVLAVAQIACAVLLVIAAGLLIRSLWTLWRADPGFQPAGIVTARLAPTQPLCESIDRCLAFYHDLDERLNAASGLQVAAFVNTLPLTGDIAKRSIAIEGLVIPASEPAPLVWLNVITPGYLQAMQVPVLSGRTFTRADLTGPQAAIVDASTARRYWKDEDPVGRRIRFVGEEAWRTIVGVVADVRAHDLSRTVPEYMQGTLYVPYGSHGTLEGGRLPTEMTLVARTALDSRQLEGVIRQTLPAAGHDVVLSDIRSMQAVLADAVATPAATASLLASMAGLALVLGCIGVYGVLSFLVSRQTRDLAIRFALGAQRRDVFWLVLKEGALLCVAGIALGLAAAVGATRWLASELHGVGPLDPLTFVTVAIVMGLVTFAACYVPTRRAMRVDPLLVLRDQ